MPARVVSRSPGHFRRPRRSQPHCRPGELLWPGQAFVPPVPPSLCSLLFSASRPLVGSFHHPGETRCPRGVQLRRSAERTVLPRQLVLRYRGSARRTGCPLQYLPVQLAGSPRHAPVDAGPHEGVLDQRRSSCRSLVAGACPAGGQQRYCVLIQSDPTGLVGLRPFSAPRVADLPYRASHGHALHRPVDVRPLQVTYLAASATGKHGEEQDRGQVR